MHGPALAAGKTAVTLPHTVTVTLTLGQSITITAIVTGRVNASRARSQPAVAERTACYACIIG